ncbi:unnamed protein product [Sphagnum jensenii]|uniref:K Homology domain-containing protein n=1 Tax=Sphagnum jensenii TaxID=128206 RepID=A0ABP0WJY7_9BRYO
MLVGLLCRSVPSFYKYSRSSYVFDLGLWRPIRVGHQTGSRSSAPQRSVRTALSAEAQRGQSGIVETIGCSSARTGVDFKAALAFVCETRQRRRARCELSGMPVADPTNSQDQVSQDIQDPELSQGDRAAERTPVVTKWRCCSTTAVVDGTEMHSASVQVDEALMGFIIGKGASTKKQIEADTGAELCIPRRDEARSHNPVVVRGPSQEAVDAAVLQIKQILEETIQSPRLQYSHFISIPLASNLTLVERVKSFRESVLTSADASSDAYRGVDESIFVKPATFHLTLLMLKLWNEERVCMAQECLQRVMPDIHKALKGHPLAVKLAGVECMQSNLQKVHVLYARVEADEQASCLLQICNVLTGAFVESGLVLQKDQEHSLKLHATLMNTTQRRNRGGRQTFRGRIPFDAREIVASYGAHDWGQHQISEVQLSQRFVYDENGYYHCCGSIPIPSLSPV